MPRFKERAYCHGSVSDLFKALDLIKSDIDERVGYPCWNPILFISWLLLVGAFRLGKWQLQYLQEQLEVLFTDCTTHGYVSYNEF